MTSAPAFGLRTESRETIDVATHRRRVVISGLIGTSIEWFDFLLYGLMAPAVFDGTCTRNMLPRWWDMARYSRILACPHEGRCPIPVA
jgi:hypothetical protein